MKVGFPCKYLATKCKWCQITNYRWINFLGNQLQFTEDIHSNDTKDHIAPIMLNVLLCKKIFTITLLEMLALEIFCKDLLSYQSHFEEAVGQKQKLSMVRRMTLTDQKVPQPFEPKMLRYGSSAWSHLTDSGNLSHRECDEYNLKLTLTCHCRERQMTREL